MCSLSSFMTSETRVKAVEILLTVILLISERQHADLSQALDPMGKFNKMRKATDFENEVFRSDYLQKFKKVLFQ